MLYSLVSPLGKNSKGSWNGRRWSGGCTSLLLTSDFYFSDDLSIHSHFRRELSSETGSNVRQRPLDCQLRRWLIRHGLAHCLPCFFVTLMFKVPVRPSAIDLTQAAGNSFQYVRWQF